MFERLLASYHILYFATCLSLPERLYVHCYMSFENFD